MQIAGCHVITLCRLTTSTQEVVAMMATVDEVIALAADVVAVAEDCLGESGVAGVAVVAFDCSASLSRHGA